MRKFNFLLMGLLFSLVAQAQSNTEFHLGYGTGSVQEAAVRSGKHPLMDIADHNQEGYTRSISAMGPLRFGIKKHESKHFLLGAEASYSNFEIGDKIQNGTMLFTNIVHYTLMASTQYKYIDKPLVTLYTGVDFGVSYATAKNHDNGRKASDLTAAYQINFMGIRCGSKLGAFAEIGLGYNGFLSGGLFYRMP